MAPMERPQQRNSGRLGAQSAAREERTMVKPWETDLSVYDDEVALLEGLRQRDRLACTCLLKRFAPRLYRLALQLTGEPDEAEDVLQEAFIQACAHVADFEGRSGLGTWLHRIVPTPPWLACAGSRSPRYRSR